MTERNQLTVSPVFHFRCPPVIRAAVESIATAEMITPSAYVRRAVARSLRADGALSSQAQPFRADQREVA
jgi:hypothetical protein